MNVLITGAKGFIGKNLVVALRQRQELILWEFDIEETVEQLHDALARTDIIFHLAGVNRPQTDAEFTRVNVGLTRNICSVLETSGRNPKIVLTSSIQAERDNPYGISKREAEEVLKEYCLRTGAEGVSYRLKNLFGKWCRPNYNSVVATFCHNIARGLPIQISDPAVSLELTYIDDVVEAFLDELNAPPRPSFRFAESLPSHTVTLGDLASSIQAFHDHRESLVLPDFTDPFVRALHATYLSYLEDDAFGYELQPRSDDRGSLAEFLKASHLGQIFISRTRPGITRGDHYHHTKIEKFVVVEGEGVIRLRRLGSDDIVSYPVRGEEYRVVDIPPGYTHSIENTGNTDLVTLFWASEPFDPERPDTWYEPVLGKA